MAEDRTRPSTPSASRPDCWRPPSAVAEDRNYDMLIAHLIEVSSSRLSSAAAEDRNYDVALLDNNGQTASDHLPGWPRIVLTASYQR